MSHLWILISKVSLCKDYTVFICTCASMWLTITTLGSKLAASIVRLCCRSFRPLQKDIHKTFSVLQSFGHVMVMYTLLLGSNEVANIGNHDAIMTGIEYGPGNYYLLLNTRMHS